MNVLEKQVCKLIYFLDIQHPHNINNWNNKIIFGIIVSVTEMKFSSIVLINVSCPPSIFSLPAAAKYHFH